MADSRKNSIKDKRVAAKLDLAEATRDESRKQAEELLEAMDYDDNTKKLVASALESKWQKELRKKILAGEDAEYEEDANEVDHEPDDDGDDSEESEGKEKGRFSDTVEEWTEDVEDDAEGDFEIEPESNEFADEFENETPGEKSIDLREGEELQISIKEDSGEEEILRLILEGPSDSSFDEKFGEEMGDEDLGPVAPGSELDDLSLEEDEPLGELNGGLDDELLGGGKKDMPEDMDVEKERFLARRKAKRREILQKLANNNNEDPVSRGFGEDTAHSGDGRGTASTKPFTMEDGLMVAGPGEDGKTVNLQNDGGNSLKSDPEFDFFDVPTENEEFLLNRNARGTMGFEGQYGDLLKQDIESADQRIPTEGGEDFLEFDVPTQLDKITKQRKGIVAKNQGTKKTLTAEKLNIFLEQKREDLIKKEYGKKVFAENYKKENILKKIALNECDAIEGNNDPVQAVQCDECNTLVVLSTKAQDEGYCPACAAIDEEAKRIAREALAKNKPAKEASMADYGNELCKDERGEDPNGDGGFRTQGKVGKAPKKQNARDMELDKGQFENKEAAIEKLSNALREEKTKMARVAAAYDAASSMADAGLIKAAEIKDQVAKFMQGDMTVHAIKNFEETAVLFANDQQKKRIAEASVSRSMQKTSGSEGLTQMYDIKTDPKPVNTTEMLKNVFSVLKEDDFDEYGRKKIR